MEDSILISKGIFLSMDVSDFKVMWKLKKCLLKYINNTTVRNTQNEIIHNKQRKKHH